jgi:phosphoribosylaminoimidazole-succinocarboxamide synthase
MPRNPYFKDYTGQKNWDQTGSPPSLPAELVGHTMDRYRELFQRLTGKAVDNLV